jgi:hypothetical protein
MWVKGALLLRFNLSKSLRKVDIFGRPLGGVISSTDFVLKYGQSVFCAVFIGSIGLMNIFARQLISDYHSFLVWAACFGLLYALPVSSQMSSLVEFTDVKNTTVVLPRDENFFARVCTKILLNNIKNKKKI